MALPSRKMTAAANREISIRRRAAGVEPTPQILTQPDEKPLFLVSITAGGRYRARAPDGGEEFEYKGLGGFLVGLRKALENLN